MDKPTRAAVPPAPRWSWKTWLIWCFAVIVIYGLIIIFMEKDKPSADKIPPEYFMIVIFVGGPIMTTFYYGIYWLIRRSAYRSIVRQGRTQDLTEKAEALQDELEKDFFTNLVRINFKYLDKYYLQTQEQGDKSFLLCCAAALIGLMIIIAGIILMFTEKTTPAYLTTAAGALSEFIAAVFFYLYNKTILSMGTYHQKLVITQNIALALKITGDFPDQERTKDVNQLLAGVPVPAKEKA
jgi:hypothetical protein